MTTSSFDDAAIARLRLAAEEVAWLTGRGYPVGTVTALAAGHHGLSELEQRALANGTCSEPQYRRRAARELEAEDVARRPLAVDAVDLVATVEAALSGAPVLQTLDGTVRAIEVDRATFAPGPRTEAAVDAILAAARGLRPSALRFVVDDGAAALEPILAARAKATKTKAEIARVPSARAALRKEKQVASGDAEVLDACAAWVNLGGLVLAGIPGAVLVKLQ